MKRSPLAPKRLAPRRNEGRIQHQRIKPKATAKSATEQRHLERIAAMPCVKTGKRPVVIHHIMHMPGKRCRRDHRFVVPLIPDFHNMGDKSVHALGGEAAFLREHGIDLVAWAIREWEKSCDMERGSPPLH